MPDSYLARRAAGRLPRVLLVDDQEVSRQALRLALGPGYEVQEVGDADEAFAALGVDVPDVVVLDVMLQGSDGFEVCRSIRRDAALQGLPVLIVTALDDLAFLTKAFEAGADDFLTKPVRREELRARVRSLVRIRTQQDAIVDLLRTRERLVQMVVHDMRTPICTVQLLSALHPPTEEQRRQNLVAIAQAAAELESMATTMLLQARLEGGGLSPRRVRTDLGRMLGERVSVQRRFAERRGVRVLFDGQSTEVVVDPGLVDRVVDNLITNAVKHTPDGGWVQVAVETAGTDLLLMVSDTGPGIPEARREAVFEPFVTTNDTSSHSSAGLGLAFCRQVAEAHGGAIFVEEARTGGACFVLALPGAVLTHRRTDAVGPERVGSTPSASK